MAGDWGTQHDENLHNLCFPPDVIRTMKLLRIRWM